MDVLVTSNESHAVVELGGRFDAHQVESFSSQIDDLLEGGIADLTVDMQRVAFIDSKAVAYLLKVMKASREAGGGLTLACLSQPVRLIMELTKLDRAFSIVDTYSPASTT